MLCRVLTKETGEKHGLSMLAATTEIMLKTGFSIIKSINSFNPCLSVLEKGGAQVLPFTSVCTVDFKIQFTHAIVMNRHYDLSKILMTDHSGDCEVKN